MQIEKTGLRRGGYPDSGRGAVPCDGREGTPGGRFIRPSIEISISGIPFESMVTVFFI